MNWKPGTGKLRFALSLFLTYSILILFSFLYYLNSHSKIDPATSKIILLMGVSLSLSAILFAWAMNSRKNHLENEVQHKSDDVHTKNAEARKAEKAASAMYQCSKMLFAHTHFEGLLESVMDLITKVMGADEGSLMLLDSNRELYIAASRGIPPDVARTVRIKIGERIAGIAAHKRHEFLIVDGLDKYPEFAGIESNPRIRSSVVCPLICQDELLGVITLNRIMIVENFTVSDMMNVSVFASQVAQALRNAYLYQTLEHKVLELESVNNQMKSLQYQFRELSKTINP